MPQLKVRTFSIGAGMAMLLFALFGAVAFAAVSRVASQQEAVLRANQVIASIDKLLVAASEAERAGNEFVLHGNPRSLEDFNTARSDLEDALDALRIGSEDRPRQRAALDSLGPMIGERFGVLTSAIGARRREGTAAGAAVLAHADSTRSSRGGMIPLLHRVRNEELVVLAERTRLMVENGRTSRNVVLIGSIAAFLLAGVALSPLGTGKSQG